MKSLAKIIFGQILLVDVVADATSIFFQFLLFEYLSPHPEAVSPRLSRAFSSSLSLYREHWTWAGVTLLLNEFLKTSVARPRPHFLETCQPKWELIDCQANGG